jgi:hypothetical protein
MLSMSMYSLILEEAQATTAALGTVLFHSTTAPKTKKNLGSSVA